jgi:hypothetical protein
VWNENFSTFALKFEALRDIQVVCDYKNESNALVNHARHLKCNILATKKLSPKIRDINGNKI